MKNFIAIICFIFMSSLAHAWNQTGHRLIAQIAYDNLKPAVRDKVKSVNGWMNQITRPQDFINSARWMDQIKGQGVSAFNGWHYIDIPYVRGHLHYHSVEHENVVWAIRQASHVLTDPKATPLFKGMFLRFLIHEVGDIHQPMHCVELYSKRFPKGDRGGTLFPIRDKHFTTLHSFWDAGVGLFDRYYDHHPLSRSEIYLLAKRIEKNHPKEQFKNQLTETDPHDWAEESFEIAIHDAYTLAPNTHPSKHYIQRGQKIAEKQLALAGYRLAALLNKLLSES